MATRDEALSFKVSTEEKRAIREAADEADESISSFARRQILNGVSMSNAEVYDGRMPPLKDFMTARLTVDRVTSVAATVDGESNPVAAPVPFAARPASAVEALASAAPAATGNTSASAATTQAAARKPVSARLPGMTPPVAVVATLPIGAVTAAVRTGTAVAATRERVSDLARERSG